MTERNAGLFVNPFTAVIGSAVRKSTGHPPHRRLQGVARRSRRLPEAAQAAHADSFDLDPLVLPTDTLASRARFSTAPKAIGGPFKVPDPAGTATATRMKLRWHIPTAFVLT